MSILIGSSFTYRALNACTLRPCTPPYHCSRSFVYLLLACSIAATFYSALSYFSPACLTGLTALHTVSLQVSRSLPVLTFKGHPPGHRTVILHLHGVAQLSTLLTLSQRVFACPLSRYIITAAISPNR
jgi:hypothetical protein